MLQYGVIISKEMKQILDDKDYDQLIIGNTVDLNQQHQITRELALFKGWY